MTKTMLAVACAATMAVACGDDADSTTTTRPRTGTSSSLSSSFANSCASCHGDEGEGKASYPAIPGAKSASESAFIELVRAGTGDMPAFTSKQISDANLKSDYLWLATKR